MLSINPQFLWPNLIWINHPYTAFSSFEKKCCNFLEWFELEYFWLTFQESFIVARAIQTMQTMSTALVWFCYPTKIDGFSIKLCARGCEPCETRWVGGGQMAGSNGRSLLVVSSKEANGGWLACSVAILCTKAKTMSTLGMGKVCGP